MSTLHLYCDLREPSLSRATQEARRLRSYRLCIGHVRTGSFCDKLLELRHIMGEDDLGLIALVHAHGDQLADASRAISLFPRDLRNRIIITASGWAPELRCWAEKNGLRFEENRYEAPRRPPWSAPRSTDAVSIPERQWVQYRLMRALIAGDPTGEVFMEIVEKLRRGIPSPDELARARTFHERGEPDMAGGNYAEERQIDPNAIDLLRERAVQVGRSGLNTLIVGETGTGKESLAWYLHDFSTRCDAPFLALNCAFFEAERLESELFGHEQGAFTDAKKAKRGLVEEADGGTIFLDELPEMAPRVQAKLLRFLQDGSYTPLGGNQVFRADVRILAAAQPGRMERLRPDLYYRVADVELHTVPLREMAARDIVNIACNLAYRLLWRPLIGETGTTTLTPDVLREVTKELTVPENAAALCGYRWPGNMRELSTRIKRFVLLGDDIFREIRDEPARKNESQVGGAVVRDEELRRFLLPAARIEEIAERGLTLKNLNAAYLRHLVATLGGKERIRPTKLAEALGCSYNTLVAHLEER